MKILTELDIKFEYFTLKDLKITDSQEAYKQLLSCAQNYYDNFQLPLSKIPGVQAGRDLFRALRIDPTRHRPSSEALLRRAMKQKGFFSVNNLVDVCNWCALDFLLPNGVYDLKKIHGNVTLREGLAGETYLALNNREVNLQSRYCLADEKGVFGSPITDSIRTSVDLETTEALAIIYAPVDYDSEKLLAQKKLMIDRISQYCQ